MRRRKSRSNETVYQGALQQKIDQSVDALLKKNGRAVLFRTNASDRQEEAVRLLKIIIIGISLKLKIKNPTAALIRNGNDLTGYLKRNEEHVLLLLEAERLTHAQQGTILRLRDKIIITVVGPDPKLTDQFLPAFLAMHAATINLEDNFRAPPAVDEPPTSTLPPPPRVSQNLLELAISVQHYD